MGGFLNERIESRGSERHVEAALIRSLEPGGSSFGGGVSGRGSLQKGEMIVEKLDGAFVIEYSDADHERGVSEADIKARNGSGGYGGGGGSSDGRLREGSKVEARYHGKAHYYPGQITRDHGDGTYDIDYDDGEHCTCELTLPEPGCYIINSEIMTVGGAEPDGADRGGVIFSLRANPGPELTEIVIAAETVEMHSLHVGRSSIICGGGWHHRHQLAKPTLSSRACGLMAFFALDGDVSRIDKIEYSLVPSVSNSLFAANGISLSGSWTEVALTCLFVDSPDRADRASGSFGFEQPNAAAQLRLRAYSRGEVVAQTSTHVAPAPRVEFKNVKLERTSHGSAVSFDLSGEDAVAITDVTYSVLQEGRCVITGNMPIPPSLASQALLAAKLETGGYAIVLNGMREDGSAVLTQVEVAELVGYVEAGLTAEPAEARTESLCVRQVAARRFRLVWANDGHRAGSLQAMKYQCLDSASSTLALAGEVRASASGELEFDAELDPGSYVMVISMGSAGALESRSYELPLQVRARVNIENLSVVAHAQLSAGWRVTFALRGNVELLAEVEYAIVVANDDGEYPIKGARAKLQWIALTEAERTTRTFVFIAPAGLTTHANVSLRAWTNDVRICYGQAEFVTSLAVHTAIPPICRPVSAARPSTAPLASTPTQRSTSNDRCGHRFGTGLTKCPICVREYENAHHLSPYAEPVTKVSRKLQRNSNLGQLHKNVAHAATLGRYATSSTRTAVVIGAVVLEERDSAAVSSGTRSARKGSRRSL